jgi:hypothetical protein
MGAVLMSAQVEDLPLPPAEGIGHRRGDPKLLGQVLADGGELLAGDVLEPDL